MEKTYLEIMASESIKEIMLSFLRTHKFEAHLTAFVLMVLASIGMVLVIDRGSPGLIWILLGGFVLANVVAILVK